MSRELLPGPNQPPVMKRHLILLFALVIVGVGGYLLVQGELSFWDGNDGSEPAGSAPTRGGPGVTSRKPHPGLRQAVGQEGPDHEALTIPYRVVDARTGKGVPGARILLFRDGSKVAETDELGRASVTGIGLPYLVFSADDYLLNHYQPRDPDTEEVLAKYEATGYVEARLEPDRFTIPFAFRFLDVDNKPAKKVAFRIVCVDDPKPGGRSVPNALTGTSHIEPAIRSAWEKHHRLCLARAGFTNTLFHLGVDSDLFDFECGAEATVRFVATGYYAIIARSAAGGFQDREFQVILNQAQPLTVQLEKGLYLKGQLLGASEQPVTGARILVRESGQVVDMAQSDTGGRFRIGPWNNRRVHLEITHNWYCPATLGPLIASDQELVVRLKPSPVQQITGVVRRRPDLTPVAGAKVIVWVEGVEETVTTTDELGRFKARSPTKQPQLHIRGKGFLPFKEIVDCGAGTSTYDLLPDNTDTRVRLGLTALLSGTVIDKEGNPAAGEPVHLRPGEPPRLSGIDGRRILEGGSLELSQTVFTDQQGRFVLEWAHAGEARLIAVKGVAPEDSGQYVNVVLGRHQKDIRLILGR